MNDVHYSKAKMFVFMMILSSKCNIFLILRNTARYLVTVLANSHLSGFM